MRIARVEPLTTARALRGPFDYRLGPGFEEVGVGSVLRVPFAGRRVLAVVVELAKESEVPEEKLAEPIEVVGESTTEELVRLGSWIAREYCSTPARGLGLMLPPGTGTGGQRVRRRTETRAAATAEGLAALADGTRLGTKQRAALEALAAGEMASSRLAAEAGVDASTLRRLEARGLITRRSARVRREVGHVEVGRASAGAPELTPEQAAAVAALSEALEMASESRSGPVPGVEGEVDGSVLLAGVTGSGKTEVYMALVERVLARGRTAIVLVPEIGLTPQAVSRFRARLGDRVAVLHSALTPGQRFDEWDRLRSGEATVCVGPRSAVFAPVSALGLVVVDEEHDPSYKQEGDPRYDARDVAAERAREAGALLVLGTATPRPESWLRQPRVTLSGRVDGRSLPPVEVLDMRRADPRDGPLHPDTLQALHEVREAGGKAIVMINRRGFAPWLTCRSCGHHWGCPNCDVSLIVHRHTGRLVCHHCAHVEPLPSACPECGGTTLSQVGAGTQRVERELAERMAPMPVLRLDADTAAARGGHAAILDRFDRAPSAILVGTQMVAKGHDFPEVTLAAILDADSTLRFPDFRAEERTFSLVTQLAGRSGRGEAGGRVLVQTLAPGAPSIASAARHDAPGFLEGELERRRILRYPPYSSLVRVMLSAEEESRVDAAASRLAAELGQALEGLADLLGPAPMFRARNRHRRRFLIKTTDRVATVEQVGATVEALAGARHFKDVAVSVDVDPQ